MSRLKGVAVWKFCVAGASIPIALKLFDMRIQNNIKREAYYLQAVSSIRGYTPFQELLGEPLEVQNINRGAASSTRIKSDHVTLDIPIKGPRDKGLVQVKANKYGEKWHVDQLDVSLVNAQKQWTFYQRELAADDGFLPE